MWTLLLEVLLSNDIVSRIATTWMPERMQMTIQACQCFSEMNSTAIFVAAATHIIPAPLADVYKDWSATVGKLHVEKHVREA